MAPEAQELRPEAGRKSSETAVPPRPDSNQTEIQKPCPDCGAPLVVRHQRLNPAAEFLGCSRYAPGQPTHCDHTEPLTPYLQAIRRGDPTLPGFDG